MPCAPGASAKLGALAAEGTRNRRFEAATGDRATLAFAAVEGCRPLATAQPRGNADAPLPVALLDYSGFRYRAGLISSPPLWSEMRLALDFADGQWRAIAGDVADAALHSSFAGDLAAMRKALDRSNAAAARSAVAAQLDRVDALETYFAQRPPR